jgi:hypothetical protein
MKTAEIRSLVRALIRRSGNTLDVTFTVGDAGGKLHLLSSDNQALCSCEAARWVQDGHRRVPRTLEPQEVPLRVLLSESAPSPSCWFLLQHWPSVLASTGPELAWCNGRWVLVEKLWAAEKLGRQLSSSSPALRLKAMQSAESMRSRTESLWTETSGVSPTWAKDWFDEVVGLLDARSEISTDQVRAAARGAILNEMRSLREPLPGPDEELVFLGADFAPRSGGMLHDLYVGFGMGASARRHVLAVPVSMTGWVFAQWSKKTTSKVSTVRVIGGPVEDVAGHMWPLVAELAESSVWEDAVRTAAALSVSAPEP